MDLKKILSQAAEILRKKQANLLPEDIALMNKEFEGPGKHLHDDDNILGLHRHGADEPLDGGHIHTPQNPGGVHAHGDNAGEPMTKNDGWHLHEDGGLGPHQHEEKDGGNNIPVVNPSNS